MGCGNCRYWKKPCDKDVDDGECRRHSPQPLVVRTVTRRDPFGNWKKYRTKSITRGVFPTTKAEDWCGEYERELPYAST